MQFNPLEIEGAWQVVPKTFDDERGSFREIFKSSAFEQHVGHPFDLVQANVSISNAGVIRGIHFAQIPSSQTKYVMCLRGEIIDYVVDLRLGSPTFGKWQGIHLHADQPGAVYLSEGLGHAFIALQNNSTVTYLCSAGYDPKREYGIFPTDPEIGIDWPKADTNGNPLSMVLSEKDLAAPSLPEVIDQGLLSTYMDALAFRDSLKR